MTIVPMHTIVYCPGDGPDEMSVSLILRHYGTLASFEGKGMTFDQLKGICEGFTTPLLIWSDLDLSDVDCEEPGRPFRIAHLTDAIEAASAWYLCAGGEPPQMSRKERVIYDGIVALCEVAHHNAQQWYFDPATGEPIERNFGEVVALMHSELSEALEHHRKGTPDDKLPDRPGPEVEFGDLFVRAADTAQHRGYDVAGAIIAKMRFNGIRPDHKPENRVKAGGKAY